MSSSPYKNYYISKGESSYDFSKLQLKLAKVKCEGVDIDGGLHHANTAVTTLTSVLGKKHTLVGAACLFAATIIYERPMSIMIEKQSKGE